MSSHYIRKTKLRNSELLRNAKAILNQTADDLSTLLEEAHVAHKKPNTTRLLFWSLLRSAQYAGKCIKSMCKEDIAIIDAVDKYCGPYE